MEATPTNSYVEATQIPTLDAQTTYELCSWVYSEAVIADKCQIHVVFYDDADAVVGAVSTDGRSEGISAGV